MSSSALRATRPEASFPFLESAHVLGRLSHGVLAGDHLERIGTDALNGAPVSCLKVRILILPCVHLVALAVVESAVKVSCDVLSHQIRPKARSHEGDPSLSHPSGSTRAPKTERAIPSLDHRASMLMEGVLSPSSANLAVITVRPSSVRSRTQYGKIVPVVLDVTSKVSVTSSPLAMWVPCLEV